MKPFYCVFWSDSETESGWERIEDIKFPTKLCMTYGYFLCENEVYECYASDFDEGTNMYNRRIFIPKVNIKKKRKVKV